MPRRTPIGWCSSPTASSPANSATRRRIGSSSTSSRWGTDVLKLALRGVLAHKVRLAMTALAIVLGVAFVAGTYVFTDSIKASFSDLFDDVNSGVDLYVSGISEFGFSSPLIDEGLVDQSLIDEGRREPEFGDAAHIEVDTRIDVVEQIRERGLDAVGKHIGAGDEGDAEHDGDRRHRKPHFVRQDSLQGELQHFRLPVTSDTRGSARSWGPSARPTACRRRG